MQLDTHAIVCAVRHHGEHGAIARLLTPSDGLQAGYVRGGRSRRLRPVLLPGNLVAAAFRARTDDQLAHLAVELSHSRAPLLAEPLAAAAIDWSCALVAVALPEAQPYPRLYEALDAVLAAVEAAPSAKGWAATLVRFEMLMLRELGFGIDRAQWPQFVRDRTEPDWGTLIAALGVTGNLLARDLLTDRRAAVLPARARLLARLRRVTR